MKKLFLIFLIGIFVHVQLKAQGDTALANERVNTVQKMHYKDNKFVIGGYGQVDYNQQLSSETNYNGNMDVHRIVLLFGYKFDNKTSVYTEVEYEHVQEVFIEQAFINHKINPWLNFRAGLMLIPMGIINEYHEPPIFNGVERPNLDKYIVPSTWREIGAGFMGRVDEYSLKYQIYITNGLLGYDGDARFNGQNGLRGGRQKGMESVFSFPNFAGRIDYFAIPGLKLGLSGYFGKSQSTAYQGIDKNDEMLKSTADSTVVGISMLGFDAQYNIAGFGFTGQLYYSKHNNVLQYNTFTGSDLGKSLFGYYIELSNNILNSLPTKHELIPFIRYENYDTQFSVSYDTPINNTSNRQEYIFGLGWKMHRNAIVKMDYQIIDNGVESKNFLNMGIGFMF
ncbi:MAG: hypothetical protein L3J74_02410 [Bacteroidales bacterium]|nr:hypothetical protein [Bacteroidales bacterium]